MASFFSCCFIITLLLAIILGILNSNHPTVNELLVTKVLSGFKTGIFCTRLLEQNGDILAYGDLPSNIGQASVISESKANEICNTLIDVHNKAALYSGFLRGTIGIGETYFRKEWTFNTEKYDLGDIVTHMFWNVLNNAGPYTGYLAYLSKFEWQEYFYRQGLTKDESQDMQDVCYTYFDYRFFEKMLDKTMQYTCALYNSSIDNLYDAQINKADVLFHKLNTAPLVNDDNVDNINILDVGSGWGFLINYIGSKSKKFNVTGVTIAKDQYQYAIRNFQNPTYYLMDFRNLLNMYGPNYFDRIISVGVISHIHVLRLDEWFNIIYKILKPGGYFVMQGIVGTTAFANGNKAWLDVRYGCQTNNFIYKYIFPGGCVLLSDWMHESAIKNGFITMHRDFIGQHYSRTLHQWRTNIKTHKEYLINENIVSEKKFLSHEMYLAQAEALYRTGKIDKTQFVFYKPIKDEIHKHKFEDYQNDIHLSWQDFWNVYQNQE